MRNFQPIHIAVNLCLIVAMTIQPVTACLVGAGEASGCAAIEQGSFTCGGCGCCQVETESDRCCCCASAEKAKPKAPAKHSCCSSSDEAQPESKVTGQPTNPDVESIEPFEGEIRSVCLCEQSSQPLPDPSPRRSSSENRDTLSVQLADVCGSSWDALRTLASSQQRECGTLSRHHSQVVLCIWRL